MPNPLAPDARRAAERIWRDKPGLTNVGVMREHFVMEVTRIIQEETACAEMAAALEWYADVHNYIDRVVRRTGDLAPPEVKRDHGTRARAALARYRKEEKGD